MCCLIDWEEYGVARYCRNVCSGGVAVAVWRSMYIRRSTDAGQQGFAREAAIMATEDTMQSRHMRHQARDGILDVLPDELDAIESVVKWPSLWIWDDKAAFSIGSSIRSTPDADADRNSLYPYKYMETWRETAADAATRSWLSAASLGRADALYLCRAGRAPGG